MKTIKGQATALGQLPALGQLLVLVPHRDARLPLRAWSASLFSAAVPGAWSFPWVAPLAQLSRPLSGDELKRLAHALRLHINGDGGKFIASSPSFSALPAAICGGKKASVFGPSLATDLTDDFFSPIADAVKSRILPLVVGSALARPEDELALANPTPAPLPISFRAAALANMSYGPLDDGGSNDYSFEWVIGALHWLPKTAG
jgi:hypothetical protein